MNILFPVSECVPFAKTGGLADVAGALPQALTALGNTVHVIMPFYRHVREGSHDIVNTDERIEVAVGSEKITAEIWQTSLGSDGPFVYFLKQDDFFDRHELYRGYEDNDKRFVFFCRGVMELGMHLSRRWDVIHCHDWHTGLIPVMLKTLYRNEPVYKGAKSLITIHNLAYQGHFSKETMTLAHLPWEQFHADGLEFYDGLNFLKAGLVYADGISTVSETYAKEIQLSDIGYGLDGVLKARQNKLSGIVNGIDYALWDPAIDKSLPSNFSVQSLENKQQVKQALLEKTRLLPLEGAPILGMITRLDDQKGLDIFDAALEQLMQLEMQIIILGTGEQKYHDRLLQMKARYPRKLSVNLEFNNEFAHLIYAGTDLFLMPSKYEPCGLGQLISMKYGSIPVVRHTGGLADTVSEFDGEKGTGFLFHHYSSTSLFQAVMRAVDKYQSPEDWRILIHNAMTQDYSWHRSALAYHALYENLLRQ